MWTTKIIQVLKKEGKATISVEYTDGIESFVKDYYALLPSNDKSWLNEQIKNEIAGFEAIYTFADSVKKGTFTPTDPVVTLPDPKKQELIGKLKLLEEKKYQLSLGLIKQADYDLFLTEVKGLVDEAGGL